MKPKLLCGLLAALLAPNITPAAALKIDDTTKEIVIEKVVKVPSAFTFDFLNGSFLNVESGGTVNAKSGATVSFASGSTIGLFGTNVTSLSGIKTAIGLGSVENTALSSWTGSTNITTLGTIATGTWQGTRIAPAYLGTGSSITTKFLRGDGTWQTVSGAGDMMRAVYDSFNTGFISGLPGTDAGGVGGSLIFYGGDGQSVIDDNDGITSITGLGGNGGGINMYGGNGYAADNFGTPGGDFANGGTGGSIYMYGAAGAASAAHGGNGGNLYMNATGTQSAGDIDTTAGGSLAMGTGNLNGGAVDGTILTTTGDGSGLTNLNATALNMGTINIARLPASVVQTTDTATVTNAMLAGSIAASKISSGTLAVANGGTGQSSYTNGQLLIGNTTGNTLTKATLTAGSGITITNGGGSITIAQTTDTTNASNISSGTLSASRLPDTYSPVRTILTEQATTSGTAWDWTGLPSGITEFTLHFNGFSTNGTSDVIVLLGDAGGFENSGYDSAASTIASNTPGTQSSTSGAILNGSAMVATYTVSGQVTFLLAYGSTWTWSGSLRRGGSTATYHVSGTKTLSPGPLTQVRLTTTAGDAGDAGTVNGSCRK